MNGRPSGVGAALLTELHQALTRYVVLPSTEAADAVVLWVAATHAVPAWEHATRLVIKSPEKRCGKSRLLDVIEATCHRPLITVSISPAALVRSVTENDPPTILLDEADTVFGPKVKDSNEDLRGIINSGHGRNRPYVRWDVNTRRLENCPTFAMAALAGIGSMPDTIEDRAVVVTMRRRAPGESVDPFRTRRDGPALASLRDRLHQWMDSRAGELQHAEPGMPVEDRAADTWESLIAVADAAGGDWPQRARKAALVMCKAAGEAETDRSTGTRLLADIREVLREVGGDFVSSTELVAQLRKIDEAPWAAFDLTVRKLALRLGEYGVRAGRNTARTIRGYHAADFALAFASYLPSVSVQPSETWPDQGIHPDTSTDASTPLIRPDTSPDACETAIRPAVSAGQVGSADAWTLLDAMAPATGTCARCAEPMAVITPGQKCHPTCEPEADS